MLSQDEYFSPRIKTLDRPLTSNIYNYLYSYANKYANNKNKRIEDLEENIKRNAETKYATNDSEYLFYKMKMESFQKIFKLLDNSKDGVLSIYNLDVKKLPTNISKIMDPIFRELKEEEETLNESEFVTACDHLYNVYFNNIDDRL
jgi:hypothetical protein